MIAFFVSTFGLFNASQSPSSAAAEGGNLQNNIDARALFAKHCATCHGKDGRAKTSKGKLMHARNLADPEWQARVTDERIFNSVNNGRGEMPGFDKKLSETQIDALASYVRQLKK